MLKWKTMIAALLVLAAAPTLAAERGGTAMEARAEMAAKRRLQAAQEQGAASQPADQRSQEQPQELPQEQPQEQSQAPEEQPHAND
jgi:hypothetical protein